MGIQAIPISTTNLLADYRADLGITLNGSGRVSAWADQSGNANAATEVSSARDPAYLLSSPENCAVVFEFGSGNVSNALNIPTAVTINQRACTVLMCAEWQFNDDALSTGRTLFASNSAAVLTVQQATGQVCGISGTGSQLASGIVMPSHKSALLWTAGASNQIINVNGNRATLAAAQAVTNSNLGWLGSWFASQPGYFKLYRCIVFGRQISSSEEATMVSYFSDNYGVVTSPTVLVCYEGDSLTAGSQGDWNQNAPSQVRIPNLGYYNFGIPGQTIATIAANGTTKAASVYDATKTCIYVLDAMTNDLDAGVAPATAYANYRTQALAAKAIGYKVIAVTIAPRSSSSGTFEADRQTANALLRADSSIYAAISDVGADVSIGVVGDNTNRVFYGTDGVHLTPRGYGIKGGLHNKAIVKVLNAPTGLFVGNYASYKV